MQATSDHYPSAAPAGSHEKRRFFIERRAPWRLELGGDIARLKVSYYTWGRLNATRDNAVVVCHALTQSADVEEWWADMLGVGKALDPDRDFIICSNVLGGCFGTTGPASLDASTGRPFGPAFPTITIRDIVAVQQWMVEKLGVRHIRMVIGAALGAMQALEWALLAPSYVGSVATIAACGRQSAWRTALSESQRCAIHADPLFCQGNYTPERQPKTGLATARMIATCMYRTPASFEARFVRQAQDGQCLAVAGFLHEQGLAFAEQFDANSYVTLTRAMDTHDLARGRGDYRSVLAGIKTPALIVSVPADLLYLTEEQSELVGAMPNAHFVHLRSIHGHDAFLLEGKALNAVVSEYRERLAAGARHAPTEPRRRKSRLR
jgi:homoserine O-acetyltransferase/O-succinyltransferase